LKPYGVKNGLPVNLLLIITQNTHTMIENVSHIVRI